MNRIQELGRLEPSCATRGHSWRVAREYQSFGDRFSGVWSKFYSCSSNSGAVTECAIFALSAFTLCPEFARD